VAPDDIDKRAFQFSSLASVRDVRCEAKSEEMSGKLRPGSSETLIFRPGIPTSSEPRRERLC